MAVTRLPPCRPGSAGSPTRGWVLASGLGLSPAARAGADGRAWACRPSLVHSIFCVWFFQFPNSSGVPVPIGTPGWRNFCEVQNWTWKGIGIWNIHLGLLTVVGPQQRSGVSFG